MAIGAIVALGTRPSAGDDLGVRLTRRRLLAAAIATAASGALLRVAPALGRRAAGSFAERETIYRAIIEAVAVLPDNQLDVARAEQAASRFALAFERRLADWRMEVDGVLRRLERGAPGGSFTALDPVARLDVLRAWSRAEGPRARRLRTDADAAVALVAEPFNPDPEDFHPTPVVL